MRQDPGYDASSELPELYDQIPLYQVRPDIEFYAGLCREAGEALELGCGTGRILITAARAGCRMTGLDQSAGMLARCRAKIASLPPGVPETITLVQGDITRFEFSGKFPLVIAPFRPLQHLTAVTDQFAFLRCVREHLAPGGRLVFDVFHPNLGMLAAAVNPDEVEDTPEQLLPDGRRMRRAYRITRKRPAEQVNDVEMIWYLDGRRTVQSFPMRYFFRFELEHLLALAGFRVTALYGDFDGSPFTDSSPEMIFTATA